MRAFVLGAGVAGITAAYALSRAGIRTEVLERQNAPALECSRANGGQLSYSHSEPWSEPGIGFVALRYLLTPGSPFAVRAPLAEGAPLWALRFWAASRRERFERVRALLSELAFESRRVLRAWLEQEGDPEGKAFGLKRAGLRHTAMSAREWRALQAHARAKPDVPYREERGEDLPPSLRGKVYGSVLYPQDETGDVRMFCEWLAERLRASGNVVFRYGAEAECLVTERGRTRGVRLRGGEVAGEDADIFVIAAGAYARKLCPLPLYPLKGYSLTYHLREPEGEAFGLTDPFRKVVYSRLSGGRLRLAGMADMEGFNTVPHSGRLAVLRRHAATLFPETAAMTPADEWACLRPFLPDGLPAVGRLPGTDNLYVHTGHGSLGWTLSAATAELLASYVLGEEEREAFSPLRFGGGKAVSACGVG